MELSCERKSLHHFDIQHKACSNWILLVSGSDSLLETPYAKSVLERSIRKNSPLFSAAQE